jgi:hypothetical protein
MMQNDEDVEDSQVLYFSYVATKDTKEYTN